MPSVKLTHNEKVFMKKGGFETGTPVTGAVFCSKVELLPTGFMVLRPLVQMLINILMFNYFRSTPFS
jgi:hypothetical protein